ncbi:MAG: hypothetical protein H7296_01640 [Bacteroidia bacterium]|nr:hypothetical protein [Bacteroidia bacterium]
MQKIKILFSFLFICAQINLLFAERTGGTCYLKAEKDGKDVLELSAGVDFYAVPEGKIFQKVWIECWVQTKKLYDGIQLQNKTKLYTGNRKFIGKVLQAFNPMQVLEEKDSMTHIQLSGFIENSCTDHDYIPEKDLGSLLLKATKNAKLNYFDPFLKKYCFIKQQENNNYTSYLISEPEFVSMTLLPRILMIFYKEELIAVFHTRSVEVKLYDSIEMESEYKMIYNSKFTEHTKKEMVEIYRKKLEKN